MCSLWICPSQWEGIDFSSGAGWFKVLVFTSHSTARTTGWQRLFICLCQKHCSSYPSAAFSSQINENTSTLILVWSDNTHTHTHTHTHTQTYTCLLKNENTNMRMEQFLILFLEAYWGCLVSCRVTCLPSKHWHYPLDTPALDQTLASATKECKHRGPYTGWHLFTCEGLR